jgi:hypothetical protein
MNAHALHGDLAYPGLTLSMSICHLLVQRKAFAGLEGSSKIRGWLVSVPTDAWADPCPSLTDPNFDPRGFGRSFLPFVTHMGLRWPSLPGTATNYTTAMPTEVVQADEEKAGRVAMPKLHAAPPSLLLVFNQAPHTTSVLQVQQMRMVPVKDEGQDVGGRRDGAGRMEKARGPES